MNNIRKGLQIVSKKFNNLGEFQRRILIEFNNLDEFQRRILIGFSTVTLFSGSITGVHSYKMGKNFNEIEKTH